MPVCVDSHSQVTSNNLGFSPFDTSPLPDLSKIRSPPLKTHREKDSSATESLRLHPYPTHAPSSPYPSTAVLRVKHGAWLATSRDTRWRLRSRAQRFAQNRAYMVSVISRSLISPQFYTQLVSCLLHEAILNGLAEAVDNIQASGALQLGEGYIHLHGMF